MPTSRSSHHSLLQLPHHEDWQCLQQLPPAVPQQWLVLQLVGLVLLLVLRAIGDSQEMLLLPLLLQHCQLAHQLLRQPACLSQANWSGVSSRQVRLACLRTAVADTATHSNQQQPSMHFSTFSLHVWAVALGSQQLCLPAEFPTFSTSDPAHTYCRWRCCRLKPYRAPVDS